MLEAAVFAARLTTYRAAARDDHAWALHRWNVDLAAAFIPIACDIEVALRNTIHDQLTIRFGRPDWWASTNLILDDITTETLTSVVQRHLMTPTRLARLLNAAALFAIAMCGVTLIVAIATRAATGLDTRAHVADSCVGLDRGQGPSRCRGDSPS